MIGYTTNSPHSWHLAFLTACNDKAASTPRLWILPAGSCICAPKASAPESLGKLTAEFRRFVLAKNAIAISLYQHPRHFGPLFLGAESEIQEFLYSESCHTSAESELKRAGQCNIRNILLDLSISRVRLQYPDIPGDNEFAGQD
jgi:hypothetical protein